MNEESAEVYDLLFVIFLIFLVLKLIGAITWSWWWVTCPLWIPIALGFVGLVFYFIFCLIATIFE